jgi:hypothetical protein
MTNGIYRAETPPQSVANVTALENDFIITRGTPEPATFAMLGGGLVALGALRRQEVELIFWLSFNRSCFLLLRTGWQRCRPVFGL